MAYGFCGRKATLQPTPPPPPPPPPTTTTTTRVKRERRPAGGYLEVHLAEDGIWTRRNFRQTYNYDRDTDTETFEL